MIKGQEKTMLVYTGNYQRKSNEYNITEEGPFGPNYNFIYDKCVPEGLFIGWKLVARLPLNAKKELEYFKNKFRSIKMVIVDSVPEQIKM